MQTKIYNSSSTLLTESLDHFFRFNLQQKKENRVLTYSHLGYEGDKGVYILLGFTVVSHWALFSWA